MPQPPQHTEEEILDIFYANLEYAEKLLEVKKHLEVLDAAREEEQAKALPRISTHMRKELWARHFGTCTKGSCFSCKAHIDAFQWDIGFIVANSGCGLENMKPLCKTCHVYMGDRDIMVKHFMNKSKREVRFE
jgi:hypothetical protein